MKIELIHPSLEKTAYVGCEGPKIGSLTLLTVAALVPSDIEVKITDERVEDINFDSGWPDLVGITFMSRLATRAYRIATEYKKRNIPVVFGGIHTTAMPQEASQYADTIVIGEAENIWPRLIEDFKKGRLQKTYYAEELPDLKNMPLPRRDLLNRKKYITVNTIQATRGCPHHCSYCFTPNFFRHRFRVRPIKEVVREVNTIKERELIFVDDNIIGDTRYAKELFKALIQCKKLWFSQCSIKIAYDQELLELAAKSGCRALLIGFESLSTENLKSTGKEWSLVKNYKEAIKKIHNQGISIFASFVVGFDYDDKGVFERLLNFLVENDIEFVQCPPLAYFPGTEIQQNPASEEKLFEKRWWLKDFPHLYKVHHTPKLMSVEELENGCKWLMKEFYSYRSIFKRLMRSPLSMKGYHFVANMGFRKICLDIPIKGYNPNDNKDRAY